MEIYLVGGAVRDHLLGIADDNTEQDWVVVGASPKELLDLGYRQVGKQFPVFLHPHTQQEYALARLERKVGAGYKGFEFDTSAKVSLLQDLSRRDLTINAIAEKDGELIDPFNGQADLHNGLLKHISAAFAEDPVRVLRTARFAARFKAFGFKVAPTTEQLMQQMVASGEVDSLTPERVFKELDQALSYATPAAFFQVLSACGADKKIFPMLNNHNTFAHFDQLATEQPLTKFAIWLHGENSSVVEELCQHIKCPKNYQQLAVLASKWHKFVHNFRQHSAAAILEFFSKTDALRRGERFQQLLKIFALLGSDIKPIETLLVALNNIDTANLDKHNIAAEIRQRKLSIIALFLQPTK